MRRRRSLPRAERALLDRVVAAVRAVEPTAQVILYGSRARGDAAPDSDWDLLVLLDGAVDRERAEAVRQRLYELELELDDCPVLVALVHSKEEWASPQYRAMPLHANVTREGLLLYAGGSRGVGPRVTVYDGQPASEEMMAEARDTLVRYHIAQARDALSDAELLLREGRWKAGVNRLYYACFYAVTAVLLAEGRSSAKHGGVRSLFHRYLVKTGRVPREFGVLYDTLFENRLRADYEAFVEFDEHEVAPWLVDAERFVAAMRGLLAPGPAGPPDA